jgi:tetratricopeptide (TPR) repeat protein
MRPARSLRPRGRGLGRVGGLALLVLATRTLSAQAIGQGFELERVGQFAQAAASYFATLRAEPTNLSALLGLERVLPGLGRLPELLPVAQRATTASPTNVALRSVLLRTYVELSEPDSARAVALRWIAAAPRDEAPYREWAMALEDQRRHEAARAVLVDGRRALGRPEAFGIELAELAERSGDWEEAAREWAAALSGAPAQLPYAASELGAAPPSHRDRIARVLTAGDPPPLTRRLAGELLLTWGQPERGWAVYAPSVATPLADAAGAARHFADLAAARPTPGARRVRALALARYAELAAGPVAVRARAEAARALLEIGDRVGARSTLEAVARDSAAPADAQALAQTTLVAALIDAGQLDEAAQRLARDDRLTEDDRATLRLRLAHGRIAQGDLDRADATLARDSSVAALALKGWIAVFRGRLNDAELLFLAAGPYAGDRRDATDRTGMLALLDRVAADTFAELGQALLALARGDSVRAAAALRHAADQQAAAGPGRPDILLLAGRVAAPLGPAEQLAALSMFADVVRTDSAGAAAPAAELEWARLLERRLEPAAAIQHLEHLILSYPRSAVVPEARRELDRAKGAIPRS